MSIKGPCAKGLQCHWRVVASGRRGTPLRGTSGCCPFLPFHFSGLRQRVSSTVCSPHHDGRKKWRQNTSKTVNQDKSFLSVTSHTGNAFWLLRPFSPTSENPLLPHSACLFTGLISLSMLSSGFIHTVAYARAAFPLRLTKTLLCVHTTYWSTDGM